MRCPHCDIGVSESWRDAAPHLVLRDPEQEDFSAELSLASMYCPECHRPVIKLLRLTQDGSEEWFVYPRGEASRRTADRAVPPEKRVDYEEAAAVLPTSAQASAAISRRLIQSILSEGGYSGQHLDKQIVAFIADPKNPSRLKENLDYLRELGNFSTHEIKSARTGEVMRVEPGEAEWCLEVLDGLLDFYHVGPARDAHRRRQFNERVAEAGREPLSPS